MATSEPTTGEIVRALRCDGDANNCVDCRYATYDTASIFCDQDQYVHDAADRLESQEREISVLRDVSERQDDRLISQEGAHIETMRELSGITGEFERFRAFHERYAEQTSKKYIDDICALTARAEQADRERDAAVNALTLYEDALFDECDKSYQSGFMDGFQSREEIDDED